MDVAVQDQEIVNSEISKTVKAMIEMLKDPEMMKRFEMFIKGND